MKTFRSFVAARAIAAVALCALLPRVASADGITSVSTPTVQFQGPSCATSAVFTSIVRGAPNQQFIWVVNYTINGVAGNTGSSPQTVRIPASGMVPITYTLDFAGLRQANGTLSFNTQTQPQPVNTDSGVASFASCMAGIQVGPVSATPLKGNCAGWIRAAGSIRGRGASPATLSYHWSYGAKMGAEQSLTVPQGSTSNLIFDFPATAEIGAVRLVVDSPFNVASDQVDFRLPFGLRVPPPPSPGQPPVVCASVVPAG